MTKFVADSSCDLITMEHVNFQSVPLTISTDKDCFVDNKDLDVQNMLDTLEKYNGRSYTACPGTEQWLEAFEGADRIYVVVLTSTLSGAYNSACVARDLYLAEHPETEIAIFDTLTTGPELRLLVEKIMELDKAGLPFEEVCRRAEEYVSTTRLFFSFVSLHNFAQNGRVSKVVASAVGILGISIVGTASEDGNIAPKTKCRGDRKVITTLLKELADAGYEGGKLRICHIDNERFGKLVAHAIKEHFDAEDIIVYPARGLCSYYGERGGIILGCECKKSITGRI